MINLKSRDPSEIHLILWIFYTNDGHKYRTQYKTSHNCSLESITQFLNYLLQDSINTNNSTM